MTDASGTPARGYSWPPFQPGHELSMRHGAYSPRRVDPLAEVLVEQLLEQATADRSPIAYLADVTYRSAVWAWAKLEVQVQLVEEWLADRDSIGIDGDGGVIGAANHLVRLRSQAERHRARLGLDPLSRARLGRDLAAGSVDMAKLLAELDDEEADTDAD